MKAGQKNTAVFATTLVPKVSFARRFQRDAKGVFARAAAVVRAINKSVRALVSIPKAILSIVGDVASDALRASVARKESASSLVGWDCWNVETHA
jgi:hypothetical protein